MAQTIENNADGQLSQRNSATQRHTIGSLRAEDQNRASHLNPGPYFQDALLTALNQRSYDRTILMNFSSI